MFRFVPVMSKDLSLMRQSVHTRGFFKTLREKVVAFPEYMEIIIAPLMLRIIRIAESLFCISRKLEEYHYQGAGSRIHLLKSKYQIY